MNNKFTAIATFLRVAEAGSLSAATRQLGMKRSTISQWIITLEQELGVMLFHRTVRTMMPTEQKEHYRCDMQRVLNAMQGVERRLNLAEPQLRGRVHVQLPNDLGGFLLPHLLALQKQYPELHLMLSLDDRITDLVTEGVDVVLCLGHEPSSSHTAWVPMRIETTLSAVPGYYVVQSVDDLAACPYVQSSGLPFDVPLRIVSADETRNVQVKIVFWVNTSDALLQALESDIGIGGMQRPLAAQALRAGRLVPILTDWRLPDRPLYVVYLDACFIPPRVRSVITLTEARLPELAVGS